MKHSEREPLITSDRRFTLSAGSRWYDHSMSTAARILTLAGLGMVAFGSWGMFTDQGRRNYDEMAGIIPVAASATGGIFLLTAALIAILGHYRRRQFTKSRSTTVSDRSSSL